MTEWLPTIIAILGAPLSGYIGVLVGNARMEERHKALVDRMDFIHDEIFGTRKIKERLHQAEADIIHLKHTKKDWE